MKIYSTLEDFFEEQNENLINAIVNLNKILNDDVVLIIGTNDNQIEHFYFTSKKMEKLNLDINMDNYIYSGEEDISENFAISVKNVYEKLYEKSMNLSSSDSDNLLELSSYFTQADNKIGFAEFPHDIEQYVFTSKGLNIEYVKTKEKTLKKSKP